MVSLKLITERSCSAGHMNSKPCLSSFLSSDAPSLILTLLSWWFETFKNQDLPRNQLRSREPTNIIVNLLAVILITYSSMITYILRAKNESIPKFYSINRSFLVLSFKGILVFLLNL